MNVRQCLNVKDKKCKYCTVQSINYYEHAVSFVLSSSRNYKHILQEYSLIYLIAVCHWPLMAFVTADILTYSKSTVLLIYHTLRMGPLYSIWWRANTHNTGTLKLKQLHGIQPTLILLFTPVLFFLGKKRVLVPKALNSIKTIKINCEINY